MKKRSFVFAILSILVLTSCDMFLPQAPSARKRSSKEETSIRNKSSNDESSSKTSSYHRHNWGDAVVTKAPTCTENGSQTMTCTICGQERTQSIPATGHSEAPADDSHDWVLISEPTCEQSGSRAYYCEYCGGEIMVEVPALGHMYAVNEYGQEIIEWTKEPSCTDFGEGTKRCQREGCSHEEYISVAALGHDFPTSGLELPIPSATEKNIFGDDTIWAHITNYSCSRGDSFRYAWSAKEVNFDYKNVAEGSEPELVDDGEGVRFFGRPVGNAMELDSEGNPIDRGDTTKVPDPTVKGSRFEFDFVFDEDLTNVCLSADLTPAQYTNDVFKNRAGEQEWFPGYKNFQPAVDENGNPVLDENGNLTYTGEIISPFRYIIYLDGVEVLLDNSISTAPNGRGWYQFPCRLNLTRGKHNLNIAMAGGYRHVFYQFAFEKVA